MLLATYPFGTGTCTLSAEVTNLYVFPSWSNAFKSFFVYFSIVLLLNKNVEESIRKAINM